MEGYIAVCVLRQNRGVARRNRRWNRRESARRSSRKGTTVETCQFSVPRLPAGSASNDLVSLFPAVSARFVSSGAPLIFLNGCNARASALRSNLRGRAFGLPMCFAVRDTFFDSSPEVPPLCNSDSRGRVAGFGCRFRVDDEVVPAPINRAIFGVTKNEEKENRKGRPVISHMEEMGLEFITIAIIIATMSDRYNRILYDL